MELPFDILDCIFDNLKSDSKSLIACSRAHPVFSPIVERHLYYHIVITNDSDDDDDGYCLEPSDLIKLLSETPQIVNHVRILEILFCEYYQDTELHHYEEIALILPMFPALECIVLMAKYATSWQNALPQSFKTALEDCLRLPTLHEVQITTPEFPLSMFNNHSNITRLSLFGFPEMTGCPDETYLQLESLTLQDIDHHHDCPPFSTWAKRQIIKLHTLKCDFSNEQMILEFLEICSASLNNLDLTLKGRQSQYETTFYLDTGEVVPYSRTPPIPLINLSSLPHLKHFTIRVDIYSDDDSEYTDYPEYPEMFCVSCLPSAVQILKTASSLQNLTIEICVLDDSLWFQIDFSPLTALAESSASFDHIDLYIMDITHDEMVSMLANYEGLEKLIEQGVLVIHAGENAPGTSRFVR